MANDYKGYHLSLRHFLTGVARCPRKARKARKSFIAQSARLLLSGSSVPAPFFMPTPYPFFFVSVVDELIF
jgi:hypothetical protein